VVPLEELVATRLDLVIRQGSKFEFTIQVAGQTLPLTGWTARMEIADQRGSTGVALGHYTQADYLSVDTANGYINIDLPDTVTAAYSWTYGEYDVYGIDAGGQDRCLLTGTIRVAKAAV
jgi:hypothetical protein